MNDRISWDCRRGMLELDIVLARFMEQNFERLTQQEVEAFKRLLACSDPDLWGLIQSDETGAIQTDVRCRHVGWVERFFAKPNKPKLQEQVLLFRFVGFRDKAAQPNLHVCSTPHQFELHPDETGVDDNVRKVLLLLRQY